MVDKLLMIDRNSLYGRDRLANQRSMWDDAMANSQDCISGCEQSCLARFSRLCPVRIRALLRRATLALAAMTMRHRYPQCPPRIPKALFRMTPALTAVSSAMDILVRLLEHQIALQDRRSKLLKKRWSYIVKTNESLYEPFCGLSYRMSR